MKQQVYKTPNKYVQGLKAYVLDTLAWAYLALVSYKVIYEKIIIGECLVSSNTMKMKVLCHSRFLGSVIC